LALNGANHNTSPALNSQGGAHSEANRRRTQRLGAVCHKPRSRARWSIRACEGTSERCRGIRPGREATCRSPTALVRQHSQSNSALASRMICQAGRNSLSILIGPNLVHQSAGELLEPSFHRVKFVQHQSISAAVPAILCPTLFRSKYFRALHFCVENISILIANHMTDLLFLVGNRWVLVGNRWAILWLFTLKYVADTGPRCSSAACVQVVRIHKRCV
jgi:hypothetical protein